MMLKQLKFFSIEKDWLYFSLLLIISYTVIFCSDFNGLYGQDGHEYLRYAKALHHYFLTGTHPGDYFWGIMYPLITALIGLIFPIAFACQLLSVLAFAVSTVLVEKIILLHNDFDKTKIRIITFLFLFLSPYLFRLSTTVMSDSLCILFFVLAIYHFKKLTITFSIRNMVLLFFFSSCAITTRYAVVVPLLVFLVAAIVILQRKHLLSGKLLLLILAAALLPCVPHYIIKENPMQALYAHAWIENWSLSNFLRNNFSTVDGNAHYTFPNIIYSLLNVVDVRFFFMGIAAMFFVVKHFKRSLFIACCIASFLLYSFFLAGIPFQNLRFLCLSFPLVIIILAPGLIHLFQFTLLKFNAWIFIICFITQGILIALSFKPFINYNRTERAIASSIKQQPYKTIYTFSMKPVLENYGVKQKIVSIYDAPIDVIDSNACILFNEKHFVEQWQNTPQMKKWEFIKNNFTLTKINTYANGWELYAIK